MTMATRQRCRQLTVDIVEVIDGAPSEEVRQRVEAHAATCAECRQTMRCHAGIHHLATHAKPQYEVQRSVAPEVLAMLREARAKRHPGAVLFWTGAGATVAAVAIALLLLWQPSGPSPQHAGPGGPATVAAIEPLSVELCAREHARASLSFAPADRAAWSVALVQSNLRIRE